MNQFRKEKNISDDMQFHSGGLRADYIEWLENHFSTTDNSDYAECPSVSQEPFKPCPTCGGKGEILGFPKNELCPTCNGTGSSKGLR